MVRRPPVAGDARHTSADSFLTKGKTNPRSKLNVSEQQGTRVMQKSNLTRWSLMGSAAILAMAGATTSAQAYETKYGDVQIVFDTTVSMGASVLTQDRETQFLPETNGGPVDPRGSLALGANITGTQVVISGASLAGLGGGGFGALTPVATNVYTNNPDNFDGSINSDDGRLNFDRGDFIGANVKASHDLQVTWQNYKLFARAVGFYDVVMNDNDVGSRSQLTDAALGDVGRNYELLDLFVSADYTIAELPVNLRAGKQVINWGESTFLLNGLNVFNPIDVASFRRPGSEIKEALVPVNALFASVSFPFDVSLAGYYALDWEPFEIDPSGTPFSSADVVALGTGIGGNAGRVSFVTSSPFSGNRRNCTATATNGAGTLFIQANDLINDPNAGTQAVGNDLLECNDSDFISHIQPFTLGLHELIRIGQTNGTGGQPNLSMDMVNRVSAGLLGRGEDTFARDSGQFGLKATWFAESLNGSEFGFYYQNYHSRLPFVDVQATPSAIGTAQLTTFILGNNTDPDGVGTRKLNAAGCGLAPSAAPTFFINGANFAALAPSIAGTLGFALGNPATAGTAAFQMANTAVNDPGGIIANAATVGLPGVGIPLALQNTAGPIGFNNQLAVAQLNCVLAYYQSGFVNPVSEPQTIQTFDGAEFLLGASDGQVAVTYPEDIEVFGFSFNTTVGTWGVQGEASYRPSAPFQVDTDSLTIAALTNSCTFSQLYGLAGQLIIEPLATPDGTGIKPHCGAQDTHNSGVIRNEMFTTQIGTTATFSASEWFIEAIGADLGILVSEVGMVLVPDVEETWLDSYPARPTFPLPSNPNVIYKDMVTQYSNTGCQGTDLPGAGILGLDVKSSEQCRPTDVSAGLVLLFSLQYNNFMDTGFILAPTLVYSWDFEGTTPSPYGNYAEDRQAISLGATGTLNNNFRIGVNYNSFFGGHVNNKSRDRDFASITASYSF